MSFIVVHELAVSPSRRAVVALYKIELASSLSMSFTSSVQNEFTINHELASQLFMSSVAVHMALYKMSSQSIMSLLHRCS
jgi:hypothetical protein